MTWIGTDRESYLPLKDLDHENVGVDDLSDLF